MKNISKFIVFIIFTFILTLTVSAEEVVRISFVISEKLIVNANEESTLVVLKSDYINTDSMILPYLEMECTQGKSLIPLNTGGDGLSSLIVREGEIQLYFKKASWCDSEPRNPVGLTIVLFIVPVDIMVKIDD